MQGSGMLAARLGLDTKPAAHCWQSTPTPGFLKAFRGLSDSAAVAQALVLACAS